MDDSEDDPYLADAAAAGLNYVTDDTPGITRKRAGKGFAYYTPKGVKITDKAEIERLKKLAIPPAYKDVWICPDKKGHIQATGRDERGRKQYRYHADWSAARGVTKFNRIRDLSHALPVIRRRVTKDLKRPDVDKPYVLAGLVMLLDTLGMRIGSDSYTAENGTYGLTTLRKKHVTAGRLKVEFDYVGKGSKEIGIQLRDPDIAKFIQECEELPGKRMFQYLNGDGKPHPVTAGDVNDYLQEITGQPFTAKDFRTFRACCVLIENLSGVPTPDDVKACKKDLLTCIKSTAETMNHTPAICRSNYLHPLLMEHYESGELAWPKPITGTRAEKWFREYLDQAVP